MPNGNQSTVIEGWIRRLKDGDDQARKQQLNRTCERLNGLARKMLKGFDRVKRWEETDDVSPCQMLAILDPSRLLTNSSVEISLMSVPVPVRSEWKMAPPASACLTNRSFENSLRVLILRPMMLTPPVVSPSGFLAV
jgi:hypothetical protein